MTERGLFNATFRLRRYDREYRWKKSVGTLRFTDNGTLRCYVGSVDMTDIHQTGSQASLPTKQADTETCSKEVDGELRNSHAQLNNVLQTMPDGCQIISHDWRIIYMNDTAKCILRQQGRDDFNETVNDLPYYQHLQPVMNERVPVEFEHLYEPGKRWYQVRAYPVQDNGIAVLFHEITERKRAEAQVQDVFEVAPDATVMIGRDGRIMRVNLQTERLFGYRRDELLGRPVETLIPSRLRAAHEAHRDGYMTSPSPRPMGVGRELLALRKDGTEFAVEISLSPIETKDGMQVIAAVRDVTDQRRAKQELARLAAIVQSSDDAIISKDPAGLITSWNQSAERLFGYAAEEAIGRPITMLIPPDRDQEERHIVATALDDEEVKHYETIRRRKDGTLVDVALTISPIRNEHRSVVGASKIARDITARKQADAALKRTEAALREREERLRTAMTGGHMGAWDIDLETGALKWDVKQHELFGQSLDKTPSTQDEFYALLHPDDVDRIKQAGAVARLTGTFAEEFRIIRSDGTIRWLAGQGAIVHDQARLPLRMVGVNYDITERKNAQFQRERFTEELERQVTARTSELLASEARLRAVAIELNLAVQRERKRLATELHDHLQQMLVLGKLTIKQGKRFTVGIPNFEQMINKLDDVLSDALTYSRTLVAELSPPVLRDHGLAAGLKWLGEYMKKYDLVVTVRVPDEEVRLLEDQVLVLFQSVRELLINSAKHARTGQADVALEERNGHLHLTVHDDGAGFDLAAADFPTGGLSSKFGLFNIRERMLALGGSLDFQLTPGKGITARLVLPLDSWRETGSPMDTRREP